MKSTVTWLGLVGCSLVTLFISTVEAGGLSLYKTATSGVGLASAGWAARAQDPATLLKNPAGRSRLDGNQFQGAQLLESRWQSDRHPAYASTFYVHGLGNDIKVGWGCFHRGR